jgi:hypothetical protein
MMWKFIFFLLILVIAMGCTAPQVITDTVVKDSVIVREVPRIVEIPGQTIYSPSVNLDSLVKVIQSGVKSEVINKTLTYTDPDTQLQVGLILDQMGNLFAVCEQQEQTIKIMEREIERLRTINTTKETIIKPTFWQQAKDYLMIIIVVVIVIVVISALRSLGFF